MVTFAGVAGTLGCAGTGGSGGWGACAISDEGAYVTPGIIGTTRVLPARSTVRATSRRAASKAGEGGAITNTACVVFNFDAASAGISSRKSGFHCASVVLTRRYWRG